ncbi:hypothetical protein K1719_021236 [Acacia pycnantha]|nr:hypothetical protein K1719_021236 [Acacia pycnantha]
MYSCKLGSLALLLALSASHHFILLHCQGSGIAPDSDYGGPPPTPRPESDSYYSSPPSPPLESAPAQAPIRLIAGALEPTESVASSVCFCIWRRRRARQSAQPQPPKEEDLVSGAAAPSSSESKDNGEV